MTKPHVELSLWTTIIHGEYREMPGLTLTKAQVQRLWNLDRPTCEAVLETLQTTGVLRVGPRGQYVLDAAFP